MPRRQTASSVSERVTNHLPSACLPACLSRRLSPLRDSRYDRADLSLYGISSGGGYQAGPYYSLLSGSKPHIHDPGTGHEREANLRYHLPPLPFPPPPLSSIAAATTSYFKKGKETKKADDRVSSYFAPFHARIFLRARIGEMDWSPREKQKYSGCRRVYCFRPVIIR